MYVVSAWIAAGAMLQESCWCVPQHTRCRCADALCLCGARCVGTTAVHWPCAQSLQLLLDCLCWSIARWASLSMALGSCW
ncbi:hypothetical protein COO60DRAFT_1478585 [Scenedesmus sp. NREL 46B-D3]|nr:hypothetical protein COO60DRAFT_1478585 [Scenedesmus sp. NREL 46B-D3]